MARKYKSNLERTIGTQIKKKCKEVVYESSDDKLDYTRQYQPDFSLPNGILIECKGYHRNLREALTKLNHVKRQNPDKDLRIVWQSNIRIGKKMRASDWSEKHGWTYAFELIPEEWFDE